MPISLTKDKDRHIVTIASDVLAELGLPDTGKSPEQVNAEHALATALTTGAQRTLLNEPVNAVASALIKDCFVDVEGGECGARERIYFNHEDISGFLNSVGYHSSDKIISLARKHAALLCLDLFVDMPSEVTCAIHQSGSSVSCLVSGNIDLSERDRRRIILIAQQSLGIEVGHLELRDRLSVAGCRIAENDASITLEMSGRGLHKLGVVSHGVDKDRYDQTKAIMTHAMKLVIEDSWCGVKKSNAPPPLHGVDTAMRTHLQSWLTEFRSQLDASLFHSDVEVRNKCSNAIYANFANELDGLLTDLMSTEAKALVKISKEDGAITEFDTNIYKLDDERALELAEKMLSLAAHCMPNDIGHRIQDACLETDTSAVEAFGVPFRFSPPARPVRKMMPEPE